MGFVFSMLLYIPARLAEAPGDNMSIMLRLTMIGLRIALEMQTLRDPMISLLTHENRGHVFSV